MTDERVASHLDAIHDAATSAAEVTAGLTRQTFLSDQKAKLAGVMTLVLIGEAASRIIRHAPEYAAAHQEIDWSRIRGLRNRAVHGYDGLDFSVVWEALTRDVPVLLEQVTALLEEFGGPLPPHSGS